jgi:hypothetical protein
MGVLFTRFFALVFLIAPTYACAHVEINIDLASQTMTVHSGSGETYVWPISSGKAGHATPNGVFRPRARCTPWSIPPNTTTRRCRTPSSSTANTRSTARTRSAISAGRRRTAASASRQPMQRRCSPWCNGRERKSASLDLPSAISRAVNVAPDRRLGTRRFTIRGRSKNGRATLSLFEGARAPLTDRLITCNPRRNRAPGCRISFPFRISGHPRFELAEAV